MAKQAARYVDAIHLTVSAAYSGYTATKDVLGLARMLQNPKTKKKAASRYAEGMFILATRSKLKATKALDSLRDVRVELMKVLSENFNPGTILILVTTAASGIPSTS